MVFSSIPFLFYFLPLTLLLYYIAPRKSRNFVLLVTSLIFYAWGEPINVCFMLLSIFVNYLLGLAINGSIQHKIKKSRTLARESEFREQQGIVATTKPFTAKLLLLLSCIFNLGLLFYFKYFSFLLENLSILMQNEDLYVEIALPIGISFYTFQIMSYIIDLYRGKVRVERNLINLGAYIAMFPQLIAGPIVRFETIQDQLNKRQQSVWLFRSGCRRFIVGLAKKVIFANQAGEIWKLTQIYTDGYMPTLMAWLAVFAFTMQIYFDFSGYSDMAIGLGYMFGFKFEENFNYPYIADSITNFWQRWHISLSTWFKEYVYIPLGGNRRGKLVQIRNIIIVWLLTGMWHGANWNFLLWGMYFALLLLLEKFFLHAVLKVIPKFLRVILTFIMVNIGFAIFAETDLWRLAHLLSSMIGITPEGWVDNASIYYLSSYLFSLILMIFASTPLVKHTCSLAEGVVLNERGIGAQFMWELLQIVVGVLLVLVILSCLINSSYNPFLYFRF